jgi:hypothetical protein
MSDFPTFTDEISAASTSASRDLAERFRQRTGVQRTTAPAWSAETISYPAEDQAEDYNPLCDCPRVPAKWCQECGQCAACYKDQHQV